MKSFLGQSAEFKGTFTDFFTKLHGSIAFKFLIPNICRLITFYIFLFPGHTTAQNITKDFPDPIFEHLTIKDGLPENSVRCILQDHLGYMWFGTQNGLAQYP